MPSTTILIQIGLIVFSFITGIGFYYFLTNHAKHDRKKLMEDLVSLSINFVIYIWLGKIIVNLGKFIEDPLSILAYPSNSYAVYLASFFMVCNLVYRKRRLQEDISVIGQAFFPVLIATSFMYEILQILVQKQNYNQPYLICLAVIALAYVLLDGKLGRDRLTIYLAYLLLIGQTVLSWLFGITVFGYSLQTGYYLSLIVIITVILATRKKGKV